MSITCVKLVDPMWLKSFSNGSFCIRLFFNGYKGHTFISISRYITQVFASAPDRVNLYALAIECLTFFANLYFFYCHHFKLFLLMDSSYGL